MKKFKKTEIYYSTGERSEKDDDPDFQTPPDQPSDNSSYGFSPDMDYDFNRRKYRVGVRLNLDLTLAFSTDCKKVSTRNVRGRGRHILSIRYLIGENSP